MSTKLQLCWAEIVTKGAQINQIPALSTKVLYFSFQQKMDFFMVNLLIQLFKFWVYCTTPKRLMHVITRKISVLVGYWYQYKKNLYWWIFRIGNGRISVVLAELEFSELVFKYLPHPYWSISVIADLWVPISVCLSVGLPQTSLNSIMQQKVWTRLVHGVQLVVAS